MYVLQTRDSQARKAEIIRIVITYPPRSSKRSRCRAMMPSCIVSTIPQQECPSVIILRTPAPWRVGNLTHTTHVGRRNDLPASAHAIASRATVQIRSSSTRNHGYHATTKRKQLARTRHETIEHDDRTRVSSDRLQSRDNSGFLCRRPQALLWSHTIMHPKVRLQKKSDQWRNLATLICSTPQSTTCGTSTTSRLMGSTLC